MFSSLASTKERKQSSHPWPRGPSIRCLPLRARPDGPSSLASGDRQSGGGSRGENLPCDQVSEIMFGNRGALCFNMMNCIRATQVDLLISLGEN